MKLWVAEYCRAFTGERRLAIFHCPVNINPSFIADGMRQNGEFIQKVEKASQAMGIKTDYIEISYKTPKPRFKKRKIRKITIVK